MNLDRTREQWDAAAETFDWEADHGMLDVDTRRAWWRALDPLLPAAPAKIADLGCGTGTVSLLLAEHGHTVTGLDLSPQMISHAVHKARSPDCRFASTWETPNSQASANPLSMWSSLDTSFGRSQIR